MLRRGSLIHTEKPFVHVLSVHLRQTRCDYCYSDGDLLKCSGCKYVYYCDRNCQKLSWPDHKGECPNLLKLPQHRELPNSARLLAKILLKLKRGGGSEKGFYGKNKFRQFKDLMSHYSNMKDDPKRVEHSMCLYQILKDFLGEDALPSFPEFVGLYGRLVVNSFNILDGEMTNLGTGIYLGASTIDHSCVPNAVATFSGTTLTIRTITDIRDYKWSKVRISYIETLKSREERLAELWPQYYFECDCPRCNSQSCYNIIESSMICKSCFSPVDTKQEEVICGNCKWVPPEKMLQNYLEVYKFTKLQHEVMNNIAYLDTCKLCLEKMDGIFHVDNILYVKTLDLAFESAIQLEMWNDCLDYGQKLIEGYKKYYGSVSPVLGLHYMKYGKILLYKNMNEKALAMLEEAHAIVQITHGTDHDLYRRQLSKLLLEAKFSVCSS